MEIPTRPSDVPTITPFLWFENRAEEAAHFYVSVFKNSRILKVFRSAETGPDPQGRVLTVTFELDGQRLTAFNGGPRFQLTEAISLQVVCRTQGEGDEYWTKLSQGGEEGRAGWLKDKYGLSWQIKPGVLSEMLSNPDPAKGKRVMEAMLQMKKIEIAELQKAYDLGQE
jgi:predicted 3-demethylubiquinone-9 3-methyltransferase (glyoxalase superfamily)